MPIIEKCRLCLEIKPLIKAHILPKWCFRQGLKNFKDPSIILTKDIKRRAKTFSPGSIGIYDETILCKECDRYFSPWEKYFKEEFFDKFNSFPTLLQHPLEHPTTLAQEFSHDKIKLFFLALLWRASISNQSFYQNVSCGKKYEEKLRQMLIDKDAGDIADFPVWAKYYFDKNKKSYAALKLSPFRHRISEVNCYTFVFLGFEFSIKVDAKPTPNYLAESTLGTSDIWHVFPKRFIGSDIQQIAIKIQMRVNAEESNHLKK